MIKTHPDSRFEMRSIGEVTNGRDIVLQAEKTDSVFKDSGKSIYLCEVVAPYNYRPKSIESLSAEIIRLNVENRKLRNKVERLQKEAEK